MKKRIISLLVVIAVVISLYYIRINFYNTDNNPTANNSTSNNADGEIAASYGRLKVHFIDVGQGDSCFIELPNGESMLIDGGESKYGATVSNYISTLGYSNIDYLVATHGDADHIGGLYKVFEDFTVENCYTSPVEAKTKTYDKFVGAVEDEGIKLSKPLSGEYIVDEQNFDIEVVGPTKDLKNDTNDASVVLLVSFYEYDFLFTGDASNDVLQEYNIGDIEVLKVSHHGSRTGVSKELIAELKPEYSVISVAAVNKYNHPHQETLDLLENTEIYKTSECGSITAVCDKASLEFITEK